jgi:small multidrug resistance pump
MEALESKLMPHSLAVWLVIGLSLVGVVADTWLKMASEEARWANRFFWLGALTYASTAYFWVLAMRQFKLASLGAIYSVSTVVFLTVVGVIFFRERLLAQEWMGLALAVASLVLLSRTA